MRNVKRWALLLLTLLLTAAGAALPWTVSTIQDAFVENSSEVWVFEPVNLTLLENTGVMKALRCLAGPCTDMQWYGATNLTEEEALEAAEQIISVMDGGGLISSEDSLYHVPMQFMVEPVLLMAADGSELSAVVWICYNETGAGDLIYIDDETGKMVRAILFSDTNYLVWMEQSTKSAANSAVLGPESYDKSASETEVYNSSMSASDPRIWEKLASKWNYMLETYYGFELSEFEEVEAPESYGVQFMSALESGGSEVCELSLFFQRNGFVLFNAGT